MTPQKLRVMFANFAYGGNGGISSEHPDVREWMVPTVIKAKEDPRVEQVIFKTLSDTPITMTRNLACEIAKKNKVDVLCMVDSDMAPDLYFGVDPLAKRFWDSSFDFLYKHWHRGPCLIAAPYCGPSPHPTKGGAENIYIFHWDNKESEHADDDFSLEQFSRHEAAGRMGIEEVAALPTGLILIDVRALDRIKMPYFYYEWADESQSQKGSTEDVTFTRDMSLAGVPVYCNWDSWAGHWKPKCVGKPYMLSADQVACKFIDAVNRNQHRFEKLMMVGEGEDDANLPAETRLGPQFQTNGASRQASPAGSGQGGATTGEANGRSQHRPLPGSGAPLVGTARGAVPKVRRRGGARGKVPG